MEHAPSGPPGAARGDAMTEIRGQDTQGPQSTAGDETAVAEVLGSILLVAITVGAAVTFGLVLYNVAGPVERVSAEVRIAVSNGTAPWGSGAERLHIEHRGGAPLEAVRTAILVTVNGARDQTSGASLGGAFADGRLTIGETWTQTRTIPYGATVAVDVIHLDRHGGSSLAATARLVAGSGACSQDRTPPTVSVALSPRDVTTATVGVVVATATVADDCSGPSGTILPTLYYRLNTGQGTGGNTPWVALPVGLPATAASWNFTIPDLAWALNAGRYLQVYATAADAQGNAAQSAITSERI